MNANDFRTLIKNYQTTESDVFDKVTDNFLLEVKKELEDAFSRKHTEFFGCSGFCISITLINPCFMAFKFGITSWTLYHGKTLSKDYDLYTFDEFIQKTNLNKDNDSVRSLEIAGFQAEDIILLKPFVDALKRKGFECFADPDNQELIVTCAI